MYSEVVIEHFSHPRNVGELDDASAVGRAGEAGRGAHMVLYLRIETDRIIQACSQTYGCPAAIASGSALTEMVTGMPVAQAAAVDAGALMQVLGGLPLGKEHCAQLAVTALRDALRAAGSRAEAAP